MVLGQLATDDSRRVCEAAVTALDRLGPRLSSTEIALGRIDFGSTSDTEVGVQGSPLALASSVETPGPLIRARLDKSLLRIEVTGSQLGPLHGWVALSGPTGTTRIDVTADVGASAELPAATEVPATPASPGHVPAATPPLGVPAESRPPRTSVAPFEASVPESPTTGRGMALPVLLLAMAAAAAVMAYLLPPADYTGLFALPSEDAWWLVMPAAVILIAIPALFSSRTHPVALGMAIGSAAWAGAFCLNKR